MLKPDSDPHKPEGTIRVPALGMDTHPSDPTPKAIRSYPPPSPTSVNDLDSLHHDIAERVAFIPAAAPPSSSQSGVKHPGCFRSRLFRLYGDNQGLLLILFSQFFGSCMNVSVQILNRIDHPVPPTEILVVRQVVALSFNPKILPLTRIVFQSITWALTYAYMWHQDVPYPITGPPEVRSLLVIRGIAGFCGVFGMYYSLQYLSLSDATVLTFLSPFFTSFAGTFFLGEAFSRRNLASGLFSLVGVILIARPEALFGSSASAGSENKNFAERGTPHQRLIAVAISMIGVFGASGAYTSLRAIGERAHTLHSMNFFALFSGLISFLLMIIGKTKPVIPDQWTSGALLLGISLFGFLAQMLLILGLRKETASRGSLAVYIQIVFASMLERIFFHVTTSLLSLLGTIIILGSALYVVVTKERGAQPVQEYRNLTTEGDGEASCSGINVPQEQPGEHMVYDGDETALLEEGFALVESNPVPGDKGSSVNKARSRAQ